MKTLAIRLEEEQHAQLGMIAKLEELTVTDAIRQAIEQWIEQKRANPELQERVQAVLEEIEQDAATRRGAITALLDSKTTTTTRTPETGPSSRRSGRSKGGDAANG